ncbi:MAG: heparan-alpha-glucosaminide N-acetyltransferase domain-containing protein [Candidatus Kapaibacteriota bacterium]|jgi:uncharacterized membrane protein
MGNEIPIPSPNKKHRYIFIDALRGLAVLWMIETHVVDVVLARSFKTGWLYNLINISNGFVAVTFLFCAGAGFWIAATRKALDFRKFAPPLWQYLRRLGLILLVAYWLHFPTISYQRLWNLKWEHWLSFFQIDILQTIVYSSFFALILLLLFKNLNVLKWLYGIIALVVMLSTSFVWQIDSFAIFHPFFASWIAPFPISKFPLFPWSSYFFAGAFFTALFFQAEDKIKLSKFLFFFGTLLMLLLFYTRNLTDFYPGYKGWWLVSPFYILFRISGTVAAFALLYLLENLYREKLIGRVLQLFGQESLYVYVSHLLLVYGSVANLGMRYYVGSRLTPFATILLIIGIWVLMYFTALGWHQMKAQNIKTARWVMAATFGLFFLVFLLNPA